MTLPWYQDGLCFSCTQCGNCCTGVPGFVWVNDAEVRAIAEHLDKTVGEVRLMYTRPAKGRVSLTEYANGDCVFFDGATRRCTIYSVRPAQCRTWPFWKGNISSPEAWQSIQDGCPGAGKGQWYSLEDIEKQTQSSNP